MFATATARAIKSDPKRKLYLLYGCLDIVERLKVSHGCLAWPTWQRMLRVAVQKSLVRFREIL